MNAKLVDNKAVEEAQEILNLFRFYRCNGNLYLSAEDSVVSDLFDAVVHAVYDAKALKPHLPFNEFVHPSNEVLHQDSGWVGHFKELDNCRFFLSDVYDYLHLYFRKEIKE